MTLLTCINCGKEFKRTNFNTNRPHPGKFCSRMCRVGFLVPSIDRILKRVLVDLQTGCHVWTGSKLRTGYGNARYQGKIQYVHRITWQHKNGPVPEGLQLDHTCGNKSCCNPAHLRAVTARENSLASTSNNMAARHFRKLVCPKCAGPYSYNPAGRRFCKPCKKIHDHEYYLQKLKLMLERAGK